MDGFTWGRRLWLAGLLATLAVVCFVTRDTRSAGTTLQWDANTEPNLAGYKVHYGLASRNYTTHVDVGKVVSHSVANLMPNTVYYFAVTAYDLDGNESDYSQEVTLTTPADANETVSAPQRPTGPATGVTGTEYAYSTGGAVSSSGDPVQYRFSWSDGTVSGWLAPGVSSASKAWGAPGSYTLVSVEARCSLHTTVVSGVSPTLAVTIVAAPMETVSAPLAPSGPASGVVGTAYTYTTGGAVSSSGHPLQYRFSWSDGSVSEWLPAASASASKTWNVPGTYTLVKAEARCALDPLVVSAASPGYRVVISAGDSETVSAPAPPSGPIGGDENVRYSFSTKGAASSAGHAVRYRFHWGDGTVSDWMESGRPAKAAKSWSAPGEFLVQAEAVCSIHPTVGAISGVAKVAIGQGVAELPAGCAMLNAPGARLDFDGDGRDDIGCYDPSGTWHIYRSKKGLWLQEFGFPGTVPITGDFDGDGKSDIGVYFPPRGDWYIMKSKEGFWQTQFGYAGTIPVVGDFDGDGRDDIGCYYPPGGNWYLMKSKEGFSQTQFGYEGTEPIVGDFDADGKSDIGCYYPGGGNWYVLKSSEGFWQTQFGYAGTIPVVGDFDGDGRSDFGCYYPPGGNWYLMKSGEGFLETQFGYEGTEPVVGDFDGDGKSDIAVYHRGGGRWFTLTSAMER